MNILKVRGRPLTLDELCEIAGFKEKTAQNLLSSGTFPIKNHRPGGRADPGALFHGSIMVQFRPG
jgi:hypothetical protein